MILVFWMPASLWLTIVSIRCTPLIQAHFTLVTFYWLCLQRNTSLISLTFFYFFLPVSLYQYLVMTLTQQPSCEGSRSFLIRAAALPPLSELLRVLICVNEIYRLYKAWKMFPILRTMRVAKASVWVQRTAKFLKALLDYCSCGHRFSSC